MRIGTDLVEVARFSRSMDRPGFDRLVFAQAELELAAEWSGGRKAEFLAGRFAVKEAVLKALGTGLSGDALLTEITTLQGPLGEPVLQLSGHGLEQAMALGLSQFQVTISHDAGLVIAFVLLA